MNQVRADQGARMRTLVPLRKPAVSKQLALVTAIGHWPGPAALQPQGSQRAAKGASRRQRLPTVEPARALPPDVC